MIKYFLSVFFLIFSFHTSSQNSNENYVIDFITTKSGLSHNYVTAVVSDDLNLKWMGTENGITKFNGFDFDYIKPSDQFKELLNENIETLFVDKNSNLWIGTKSGGLSLFDIKNNKMKEFNHLIDLCRGLSRAFSKVSNFVCHHGKTSPTLASPGCLNSSI